MNKIESKQNKKTKKSKSHKHYTILPYFRYTVVYLLISMIAVVPLSIATMSKATSTVHLAQKVMTRGSNEVVLDNSFEKKTSEDFLDTVITGKLLGTITCESVGINEKVYYGANRVSLRSGVGLSGKSYLFGQGGCSLVSGYASSSFKRIPKAKIGSNVVVSTYWGIFTYKIVDVYLASEFKGSDGDSIALAVDSGNGAFSTQNDKKYYLVATLVDKEVY